jgi:hypothetical protein
MRHYIIAGLGHKRLGFIEKLQVGHKYYSALTCSYNLDYTFQQGINWGSQSCGGSVGLPGNTANAVGCQDADWPI